MQKSLISSRGIQDMLNNNPAVNDDLMARAQRVLAAAKAGAPVASGAYRDSLRIEEGRTDRQYVRVGSDLVYAPAVEARNGTLSRSLDAAR